MKIRDKVTNQIFNVHSRSIIDQMISNSKRYVEVKEVGSKKPTSQTLSIDSNDVKENGD